MLDPTVEDAIALQYAHLDTRAEPQGKLVFFLSGFTNTPAAWRNFGAHLAGYGFHVVEPHYANDGAVMEAPTAIRTRVGRRSSARTILR